MMKRRELVRGLLTLPIGVFAMSVTPRTVTAAAPVMAALAFFQAAVAFQRLFSPSGPSVSDFVAIQTELLAGITEQIIVVRDSLNLIHTRLDEVKELMGKLPAQVVVELYQRRLGGLVLRYPEIIATYSADVKASGIAAARRKNESELEIEFLRNVREVGDVLRTFPDPMVAPAVCTALQLEASAMAMAGYRDSRMLERLRNYRGWLEHMDVDTSEGSISDSILTLRKVRETTKSEASKRATCRVQLKKEFDDSICPAGMLSAIAHKYTYVQGGEMLGVARAGVPEVLERIQELLTTGLLGTDEIPERISKRGDISTGHYNRCIYVETKPLPDLFKKWDDLPVCSPDGPKWHDDRVRMASDTLELSGFRLIALRSIWDMVKKGVGFCLRLEKEVA